MLYALTVSLGTFAQFGIARVVENGESLYILTDAGKPFMGTQAQAVAKQKNLPKQPSNQNLLLLTKKMQGDTTNACEDSQAIFYRLASEYWIYMDEQSPCVDNKYAKIADAKITGSHLELSMANREATWTREVPLP